jgi:hypothetical protein
MRMSREYYKGFITKLKEDEVFCFGANQFGAHGAGTAGLAYRGNAKGWHQDTSYQNDAKRLRRDSSYRKKGNWAILGQARGLMEGKNGKSYGIVTCTYPGARRSTPLEEIYKQLVELNNFARKNKNLRFLSTVIGGGYAGYTFEEFGNLYTKLQKEEGIEENIILPESLRKYIENL